MDISVLVVDDDADIRKLLVHLLEEIGVREIVEAADGHEAVTRFQESPADLVLLDWTMPGAGGLEVIETIRRMNHRPQIVVISAESQKAHVLKAVQAGAAGYIVKPFEPGTVCEKLRSLCRGIVAHRRTADYRVGRIMTTNVVTVHENATIRQAVETLLEHRISGLPVVDAEGQLVGIITEYQLVQALFRPEVSDEPVGQFMTTEVITVEEDSLLFQVANLLIRNRMRRLPVVRDGRVVGGIARRDLLRYLIEHEEELTSFLESLRASSPSLAGATA